MLSQSVDFALKILKICPLAVVSHGIRFYQREKMEIIFDGGKHFN